uniref:Uncharacterized protein n=1 Tax=Salix viminalis TaxID=40686 RepID=A0A6N2L5R6_SALVM
MLNVKPSNDGLLFLLSCTMEQTKPNQSWLCIQQFKLALTLPIDCYDTTRSERNCNGTTMKAIQELQWILFMLSSNELQWTSYTPTKASKTFSFTPPNGATTSKMKMALAWT